MASQTDILNDVHDPDDHALRTIGGVGGTGVDPVGLKNVAEDTINPATEEKQDDIITAIGEITPGGGTGVDPVGLKDTADTPINPAKEDGNLASIKGKTDNLDLAMTALRDALAGTGAGAKTLADIVSALATVPVTGTFWQALQPISVATLPLPSGAATSALQLADGHNVTVIKNDIIQKETIAIASTTPVFGALDLKGYRWFSIIANGPGDPDYYSLEGSDDGIYWIALNAYSDGGPAPTSSFETYMGCYAPVTTRYIRVTPGAPETGFSLYLHVWEKTGNLDSVRVSFMPAITGTVTVQQGTATNLKAQAEAYQGGAAVAAGNPLQVSLANHAANGTAVKVNVASGGIASGALASGSVADGAIVTLGAKADAKSTATDTTAITAMQVLKQISYMEQTPASRAVTNAGTFAVQQTALPLATNVSGTLTLTSATTAYQITEPNVAFLVTYCNNSDTDMYWGFATLTSGGILLAKAGGTVTMMCAANNSPFFFCASAGKILNYTTTAI